ncbi:DNA gyrase subunit A [Auritidibacter ignavus]|uniref:DNA gyrase subunit A n=2 Tax=Auritidibacter ignavus TaxID=678932 RepID=A0AAJ6DEF3_9MICC|nr:DNA gyrase subunit A [Auritidibacter ignavus]WGH83305.1 DNA gyrase subunit A [Auritidibacter ignavus]WGH92548.1 DNA gyrase subunit A [Auritidibacter ignavus]
MSDELPPEIINQDKVEHIDLESEMKRSYLDYAMAVIVGRALPDVRDGLKPVHRRVLYGMYDGGYRPDRSFSKSARVVGDVMGNYHPHGDSAIYDALVRLIQDWVMRYPLAQGQGNFGSAGNDGAAAQRYTETKMAPLAMEMVRDIDEDTVDFQDNYDGRQQEPTVLPARFPNLLANGSSGIAVGMATNIPPHNLRELADGVQWYLDHPEASREELLEELLKRIKGPDFPTGAQILGHQGIEQAYRTGRGSITMRAVVNVEEIQGRTCLVVTELPYLTNPDNLASRIAEMVRDGKLSGIADLRDETSGRTGQRLVIVLKRDAVPKVVLNNLYKHTALQENFSANMLALVDGVPRTLSLDGFIHYWVKHQVDVIVRRTAYRKRKAEERAHILRGLLKALDMLDEVIATIRASASADVAREELKTLLDIDDDQARAILLMQLRQLAALEAQNIQDEYDELQAKIAEYNEILGSPIRQREVISEEMSEIIARHGDERRTEILYGYDGDVSMEDLIPEEEMVITITRGGYVKRTRIDHYRAQNRGGKGVRGAQLKGEDVVEHFFTTSTHHWILFFTNFGRVYRVKAYELQEAGRDAKGQHVANVMAFQPDEYIAQVLTLKTYQDQPYLALATKQGLVKKTRLEDYDSPRTAGVIAIKLREDDEVVAAQLVSADDDLVLISRNGQSLRFTATDEALRPMGRATSGVTGMKFKDDDELLSMGVICDDSYIFTVTDGGYAKRTSADEYRLQNRGGYGIKVANLQEARGGLVGGLVVTEDQQVLVVMKSGNVVRSAVSQVPIRGRNTMGVIFAKPGPKDSIVAVALNHPIDQEPDVDNVDKTPDTVGLEPTDQNSEVALETDHRTEEGQS